MRSSALRALDAHAHIAPDVTPAQVAALGRSVVFAMTRSLDEARQVRNRRDSVLVWGVGVHPGVAAAREAWDPEEFTALLGSFALVGEVGLDRRGGDLKRQRSIFKELLGIVRTEPVIVSTVSALRLRLSNSCTTLMCAVRSCIGSTVTPPISLVLLRPMRTSRSTQR